MSILPLSIIELICSGLLYNDWVLSSDKFIVDCYLLVWL